MSRENPLWGAPRILSELLLLGYDAAERTVAKYMVRARKPPSQTWRTLRRDCLDHMIILNEDHLQRILKSYFQYYHDSRPHLSLDRNSPTPREVELPSQSEVIAIRQVGGLHHRYSRAA